jgi:glyoxylase-like metal-dependent hydrolase (beta-lactamase superfamily II)
MKGDRVAVHIDSVAARAFDSSAAIADEKAFGFLRIVSTASRLQELLGDDEPIAVGDWLEIETQEMERQRPLVWGLQLQDQQLIGSGPGGIPARSRVSHLRRLLRAGDSTPPQDLSSAITPSLRKGSRLKHRFNLANIAPAISPGEINLHLRSYARILRNSLAVVHDVGQASFCTIKSRDSDVAVIFDAGEPIWLHIQSRPRNFRPILPEHTLVVLSHWDTDHYAYGLQKSAVLQACHWIAPAQHAIGPNAYRFAGTLNRAGKLTLVRPGRSSRHRRGIRIIYCNGRSTNGSGLALHLKTCNRNILFTGDADYYEIPSLRSLYFDGLQIPHHGGPMSPNSVVPPARNNACRAVASCGIPNRYGHPNSQTITSHTTASWAVETTATLNGRARGDRVL